MSRTTASVLFCLALATGCYDSHLGTPIDAGAPDGEIAIDGAPGTDAAPPNDAAAANDAAVVGTPMRYVISSLTIPEPSAGSAPGANLDGIDSDGGSTDPSATCEEFAPDFVAPDGTRGIDDAIGQIVPAVRGLVPGTSEGLDATLADAIRAGDLLLGIEIQGSTVSLYTLTPPDPMEVDAAGRPAPDQLFAVGTRLASARATTTGMRETVELGTVSIPATGPFGLVLGSGALSNVELRFTEDPSGLRDGELGASASVDDLVSAWDALVPGVADAARELLTSIADIDPSPAQPILCQSVSLGMRFEAVPASFVR